MLSGQRRLDFLIEQGMQPEHYFVDIGCGSPDTGAAVAGFLHPGRYVGVETKRSQVRAARKQHPPLKEATLLRTRSFNLSRLPHWVEFDYGFGWLTHHTPNRIELCLRRVIERLAPGGTFYANHNDDFAAIMAIAAKVGARAEQIGDSLVRYTTTTASARYRE
jgi:SAM-dependent methyltransferase